MKEFTAGRPALQEIKKGNYSGWKYKTPKEIQIHIKESKDFSKGNYVAI